MPFSPAPVLMDTRRMSSCGTGGRAGMGSSVVSLMQLANSVGPAAASVRDERFPACGGAVIPPHSLPAMVSWSALTNTSRLSPSVRGGRTGFPSSERGALSRRFRHVAPSGPLALDRSVSPKLAGLAAFARGPASFSSSGWLKKRLCKGASSTIRIRPARRTASTTLSRTAPIASISVATRLVSETDNEARRCKREQSNRLQASPK